MKLSKEFIEQHGLSEEAVMGIGEAFTKNLGEILPAKELEYETKYKGQANANAEAILDGATKNLSTEFGVSERNQGERYAEYLGRVRSEFTESMSKIKNDATIGLESKEYKDLLAANDENLKKLVNFDELTEKASKYDGLVVEIKQRDVNSAFESVKPKFPDSVNEYEAKAKWSSFKEGVLGSYDIVQEDGKFVAVDKENRHKKTSINDLLGENTGINDLLKSEKANNGRGFGVGKGSVTIEGVPFSIPKDATSSEKSTALNQHLESKGLTGEKRQTEFLKIWALLSK